MAEPSHPINILPVGRRFRYALAGGRVSPGVHVVAARSPDLKDILVHPFGITATIARVYGETPVRLA